jgi:hypothetical protein
MLGTCEVSVHNKMAPALDPVHTAAIEVRIRNHRAFAGQFFRLEAWSLNSTDREHL